jgi:hypothetical protein
MLQTGNVIRFKAFKGDGWYNISLNDKACSCLEFKTTGGRCKHLAALGIYRVKPFVAKTHPTFSQALSALVKSIRIRRVEEAAYWLVYLDTFPESRHRFRTARRLLLGTSEDGHSVEIMEKVVRNFSAISKPKTELRYLVAEAVRICKVPNWWQPITGGADYIYSGMVAERELAYFPGESNLETMTKMIEEGIEEGNKTKAVAGVMGLGQARVGGTKQAELILTLAKRYQDPLAERLAQVHLSARSALANDNNFLCQAVWMMAGGVSPVVHVIEPVEEGEVEELLDQARERWKTPRPIPRWCCDGVHSSGDDVRFMGTYSQMYAVCKAFEHYGRIDPQDVWLPHFQCFDGLVIERAW